MKHEEARKDVKTTEGSKEGSKAGGREGKESALLLWLQGQA